MAVTLDRNERAVLKAYLADDPGREAWISPWALSPDLEKLGAEPLAATPDGAIAVARRLTQRKLLEGNPRERGFGRGYCLTDKGFTAALDEA